MFLKINAYISFALVLIFAQIVMGADSFINFHNEMRDYEKVREKRLPSNSEKVEGKKVIQLKAKKPIEINMRKGKN